MSLTEDEIVRKQFQQTDQQLENDPNAIHADSMREERVGNLLEQINPDRLMIEIENRIRGKRLDPRLGWVDIAKEKKVISELLISNFMSFLGSILNQNVSMSNFSASEINGIMELIINQITIDLTTNDEEYGIVEDYSEMTRIANIICISCFATFKQAMNGMMARRIFGTLKVSGSLTDEHKPGFKEALNFWS